MVLCGEGKPLPEMEGLLEELTRMGASYDASGIKEIFKKILPEYTSDLQAKSIILKTAVANSDFAITSCMASFFPSPQPSPKRRGGFLPSPWGRRAGDEGERYLHYEVTAVFRIIEASHIDVHEGLN
jgi:hypothetical protein